MCSGRNGTLYTGVTSNLTRRVQEHKKNIIRGFTEKYSVHQLVYYEILGSPQDAIRREKNIKAWKREWKIRMIEELNPKWKDLSEDWIPACAGTTSAGIDVV